MHLLAWRQKASAGDIERLANLRFLTEGGVPANSYGKAELRAMVLASVHKSSTDSNLGGALKVYAQRAETAY